MWKKNNKFIAMIIVVSVIISLPFLWLFRTGSMMDSIEKEFSKELIVRFQSETSEFIAVAEPSKTNVERIVIYTRIIPYKMKSWSAQFKIRDSDGNSIQDHDSGYCETVSNLFLITKDTRVVQRDYHGPVAFRYLEYHGTSRTVADYASDIFSLTKE
ncbi:MAG: hypothetical protein KAS23_13425 [Anaerohalosphaera sp.]|nr:hypothetical protein [Anaerohalosphaera sp.]